MMMMMYSSTSSNSGAYKKNGCVYVLSVHRR